MFKAFIALVAGAMALPTVGVDAFAAANGSDRISGPFTARNLAVYFVHGASRSGPAPLTLAEALESGVATVFETGNVSRLAIQNDSDREVFVQAGDIVKGGRQDRVIAVSLLVPPKSGRVPIGAFCVEQGRWRKRGLEDVARFHSATSVLPSKAAKLAIMQPAEPKVGTPPRGQPGIVPHAAPPGSHVQQRIILAPRKGDGGEAGRQQRVWASVHAMQDKLTRNLDAPVRSDRSASSLQLSLENKRLAEARDDLVAKLKASADGAEDIIGYVIAINGRVNSGDIYPSNALFRKMWPRLIAAAASEAIAERDDSKQGSAPPVAAVRAFLTAADGAAAQHAKIDARLSRETREAKGKAVVMATRRSDGSYVHRSYVAH